jgi:hypothetical protein
MDSSPKIRRGVDSLDGRRRSVPDCEEKIVREDCEEGGLDTLAVAREVEATLTKFPNWQENPDEQRRLRLNMYKPLIGLPTEQRATAVEEIMEVLIRTAGA